MKVKVWNDNIFPHRERFKGEFIDIPAKAFVEMEEDDAIMFRGQFSSIVTDADGRPKQESFKMIRIEKPEGVKEKTVQNDPNKCFACGKILSNQGELAQHIFDFHPEAMAPEGKEEAVAALNKMKANTGKGK